MDTRSAVPTLSLNPRDARGILRANESRLTLLATSYQSGAVEGRNLGHNGYSYDFVMRQFAPLLQGCAGFEIVAGGAEEVARRAAELAKSGRRAAHIGFRALHEFELVAGIPNIAVPAWEFPDIPREPSGGSARHDWVRVANACDFVIQLCEFTRGAFERAGVTTPMAVAPVPVTPRYFDVKAWNPRQSLTIETPALVLDGETSQVAKPAQDSSTGKTTGTQSRSGLGAALRLVGEGYKKLVRPLLPWWLDRGLAAGAREALSRRASRQFGQVRESSQVTLSGVVYTSVFNPYDRRKNWEDLLSGFLLALGDRADVTLVLKLVRNDRFGAEEVLARYRALAIPHRCRVVLLPGFLSDEQMIELAQATTYYLTTTRAEGACMPLMQWLAAGRPAVSPRHTAISDYFSDEVGFVVDSHPEPCAWPHDSQMGCRTTWHRLVWTSLVDQLRSSYQAAAKDRTRYDELAAAARSMSRERHHPDRVRLKLDEIMGQLNAVAQRESTHRAA